MLIASTAGWFGLGILALFIAGSVSSFLSLFFFPLALILAYVVGDRRMVDR